MPGRGCEGPERQFINGRNEKHQLEGQWESWPGFWLGERKGITPSYLQRRSNVVEQRAQQSYPESRGG
jgi:hypothetical protein